MFLLTIPILDGATILLRPIDPEKDYKQWYEIMKDPVMHHWTGNTVPANADEIKKLLQKYKDLEDIISWSVILKNSGEMIGTYWIAVPKEDETNRLVIASEAQRIAHKFWRKGSTREARTLIYNYVFSTLKVVEVHAQAWDNNINSCRSMEKMGFKLESQIKRLFAKYNNIFIENHYVLYKEDWLN
ncbi:acetyltransferase [Bacillus cereus]|uniref:GNAT family N-acetyltransferase n=1 Tax=unclassified Bacillus cereus group TaxID=2750818 RepID=UPI0007718E4A|nr:MULTISPECIES: GNAT family N-acetyltransferase [unclassified Bacillus cereus group]KXI53957.1 acetyltransferase [Bacillus cereus]KXI87465.1 acetyltransferase [Bacillus cereus]MDX5732592.1 GNAT family N-acetyltransferase [Bacillus cereus group sp. BfR-BA-02491]MDX5787844.1 GNAT family N-acetyltransferase [Bacillus cereus group sp. WSBC 10925]